MKIRSSSISCPRDVRAPLRALQALGPLRYAEVSQPDARLHKFIIFAESEGGFADPGALTGSVDDLLEIDWFMEEEAFDTFEKAAVFDDICTLRFEFSPVLSREIAETDELDEQGRFHVDVRYEAEPCYCRSGVSFRLSVLDAADAENFALVDPKVVHSVELALKRALHLLDPQRAPNADTCAIAFDVLLVALITVERRMRDQLAEPIWVDHKDEVLTDPRGSSRRPAAAEMGD